MGMNISRIALLAATLAMGFSTSASADDDYNVWDHFAPGYYVEADDAGSADCERPEGANWIYLHPERREDATIPGVFSTFEGWMAFNFNGREEDYFLESFGGYGFDLDEPQIDMIHNFFDSLSHASARGVGLSGGGLGYTTGGVASLQFGWHIETGDVHVLSLDFEDYGRTRDIVLRGEDNMKTGTDLEGRPSRPFIHCGAE